MSAFVQSTAHIDLLVTGLVKFHVRQLTNLDLSDLNEVGRTLLRENVKSVLDRYGDSIDPEEQSEYAAQIAAYTYREVPLNPEILGAEPAVAILKAVHGYGYQSCEHDGWETSDAKRIVDLLEGACISALPGYDAAFTWAFDPDSDYGIWERLGKPGYPAVNFPTWLEQREAEQS